MLVTFGIIQFSSTCIATTSQTFEFTDTLAGILFKTGKCEQMTKLRTVSGMIHSES
jgi:hypothetical protein